MQIFHHATNHISYSKFQTLENSVSVYNCLMDEIKKFQETRTIKKEVKNAALLAMEKLKNTILILMHYLILLLPVSSGKFLIHKLT